jgi:tuftelin-interacting protein 11
VFADSLLIIVSVEPWQWVMSWLDMMPLVSMVALLEKSFFPRWLQVLGNWLSGPNPNYYEITSWYQGWKALFPEQLLADSAVKGEHICSDLRFRAC